MERPRLLALIPARGGSKGVPHKNILEVNGKPLICYTIAAALEASSRGDVANVVVSTDDEQIAAIARAAGAAVPFSRPAELAGDSAKSVDVILHALEYFQQQGVAYDGVMLLQPTTPLRTAKDISQAVDLYAASGAESLISCYREEYVSDLVTYRKQGDRAVPLNPNHNKGLRRQDTPAVYVRNGAVYITSVVYLRTACQVICDEPALLVMPKERSVNIDSYADVELLKWILQK